MGDGQFSSVGKVPINATPEFFVPPPNPAPSKDKNERTKTLPEISFFVSIADNKPNRISRLWTPSDHPMNVGLPSVNFISNACDDIFGCDDVFGRAFNTQIYKHPNVSCSFIEGAGLFSTVSMCFIGVGFDISF